MHCAYHPDREPIGACVECGRLICVECKAMLGGRMYCTPCADKKFVAKGVEPAATPPVSSPEHLPPPVPPPSEVQAASPATQSDPGGAPPPKKKRSPAVPVAIAVIAIFAAIAGGWFWFNGQGKPAPSAQKLPGASVARPDSTTAAPPSAPPRRDATGTITAGIPVAAASASISPSGGSVKVTEAGSPVAGLELTVPPNSYPDARQVKISTAPVQSHTFGPAFDPATPLITVENGGGYSDKTMKLKIPVNVPPGKFAMAFIYDDKTKTLEGLPTLAQDANSITVGTRHFSSIVVSMIDQKLLDRDIESGFRPGVDDWQFTNYGSYVAPGGHCAGQSIAAIWYFYNEPDGKNVRLYGRYDNNGDKPATPKLWQDDSLGYRFVSTLQEDIAWDSFANQLMLEYDFTDLTNWRLFAYSMYLTGQPQLTYIFSNSGGGHAMVVYKIEKGNLLIADPNYPGKERLIEYSNGKFKPYNSGANAEAIAAGQGKAYERIGYAGKGATIDWSKISRRWAEFKNRTIGNDRFPEYKVWVVEKDGSRRELTDGYRVNDKLIKIQVRFNSGEARWAIFRDGTALGFDGQGNYELVPGNNLLGVWVLAQVSGRDKYVDFKYLNVVYNPTATSSAAVALPGTIYLGAAPYQQENKMNHGLFAITAATGRYRQLTYRATDGVAVSPDGSMVASGMLSETGAGAGDPQLAFYNLKEEGKAIPSVFVLRPDDRGPLQLTGPTWSPDGKLMVVSNVGDLHLYDLANKRGSRKIVSGWDSAWSPKDNRLVVAGNSGLTIVDNALNLQDPWYADKTLVGNAFKGSAVVLQGTPSDANRPEWSPDGNSIVFVSAKGIWIIGAGGGTPRRLTPVEWKGTATTPVYSRDGKYIAFARLETEPDGGVWVMNADGSNPRQVVATNLANIWRIDLDWGP